MIILPTNHINAKHIWGSISPEYYTSPFHDSNILDGLAKSNHSYYICYADLTDNFMFTVLRRHDKFLNCFFSSSPILSDESKINEQTLIKYLKEIEKYFRLPIYFPQVYTTTQFAKLARNIPEFTNWERIPSYRIDVRNLDEDLVDRSANREGRQSYRKIKKFRLLDANIDKVYPLKFRETIMEVEEASWKYQLDQDMSSRGQLEIYEAMAQSDYSHVLCAYANDIPIAYRFDYLLNKTIYSMKWSYSELYKKYSPGFYMLVQNLTDYWKNKNVKEIDLFGSIDMLKVCIADLDDYKERLDAFWSTSDSTISHLLKNERLEHDRQIIENYNKKQSIRKIYE